MDDNNGDANVLDLAFLFVCMAIVGYESWLAALVSAPQDLPYQLPLHIPSVAQYTIEYVLVLVSS